MAEMPSLSETKLPVLYGGTTEPHWTVQLLNLSMAAKALVEINWPLDGIIAAMDQVIASAVDYYKAPTTGGTNGNSG